ANIVETANNIVKQVEKLRREYKDYNFTIIRNDADYVNRSLHSTIGTLIEGLITTGLTLFVFLRGWQSTAAVMIAIPTSLISTFLIMYMAGFTFNMMSLMGMTLCIGILVDDSIVVLENIIRHLEMGEKPEEAAENGRNEIGMAAIAITLCDAAVFMPIAFMNSMTGQFFRQFGLTIVFAGIFSLFISFTLTPMLASQFFKNGYHITRRKLWDRMDAIENWAIETYDGVVRYSLANPAKILWPSLVLFVVSVAFIPLRLVGSEYMPQTDEGGFQVIVQLPVSSTADETNKVMKKLEDYVGDIPDVQYYLSNAGGRNSYEGRMRVQLYKRADRDQSIWQVTNGLRAYAQEIPNAVIRVMEDQSSISGVSSGGGVGSVGGMMQMEMRGNDFDKLIAASDSVMKILKEDVKGTTDVNSSYLEGVSELQITADRERMKLFGVTLLDIQNAVKSSISGRDAGNLANDPLNDGQDTAIEVRFRDSDGYGMTDIANIPINAGGKIVYLSDVAQIANGTGPVMIRRVDKQRSIIIGCNLVGRPLNDVVQDTRAAISKIKLGEGITYRFRGAATQMNDTFKELLMALLLALVLIYMLLAVLYESMITPFIRMFSLPLGIIGSILLLFLTHNTVNLYSLIGILVMDGIVAKNGTLLLDYTLTLMEEKGMSAYDAIIEAGRVRLKPIFMTTITMMIGMMPTAFAMTEGAETRSSMAWVIIGGLLTSTVFTLVVVPIIFLFFENNPPRTWWSLLKKGIGSLRDKLRSRLAPASQTQS
ncbi:MAG: efflux RND transporter permease subunit, partial [Schwartzia sp.]|nr:efflux RND transporter permease subunit [Schwartzia sp. (in: firmicutes)]